MRFMQTKDGRELTIKKGDLYCKKCRTPNSKDWYYWDHWAGGLLCRDCAHNNNTLFFPDKSPGNIYLIDKIKEVKK